MGGAGTSTPCQAATVRSGPAGGPASCFVAAVSGFFLVAWLAIGLTACCGLRLRRCRPGLVPAALRLRPGFGRSGVGPGLRHADLFGSRSGRRRRLIPQQRRFLVRPGGCAAGWRSGRRPRRRGRFRAVRSRGRRCAALRSALWCRSSRLPVCGSRGRRLLARGCRIGRRCGWCRRGAPALIRRAGSGQRRSLRGVRLLCRRWVAGGSCVGRWRACCRTRGLGRLGCGPLVSRRRFPVRG